MARQMVLAGVGPFGFECFKIALNLQPTIQRGHIGPFEHCIVGEYRIQLIPIFEVEDKYVSGEQLATRGLGCDQMNVVGHIKILASHHGSFRRRHVASSVAIFSAGLRRGKKAQTIVRVLTNKVKILGCNESDMFLAGRGDVE
jgi:hypothetical protein